MENREPTFWNRYTPNYAHHREKTRQFFKKINRLKKLDDKAMATDLHRCLTTMDIILLGTGHMVGGGIYVLTGAVVRNITGPSIVISYFLAGLTSFMASLCYAEFGSKVPKAGSAYVYAYVTMGEIWAFIVGWNIILEHMIGSASIARSMSGYIDAITEGSLKKMMSISNGVGSHWISEDIDFFAFLLCLAFSGVLMFELKSSSRLNSILTSVSVSVVIFVICVGIYFSDVKNLNSPDGFAPFGIKGILAGTATCFYAYVGFDSIATASEEAMNPIRSIPRATLVSMCLVTFLYIMVSLSLVMMIPYNLVDTKASYAMAFELKNVHWAKIVVSIGAICAMCTSMFGGMFALFRCLYAISNDGLIFSSLSKIYTCSRQPLVAVVFGGLFSAVISLLLDLTTLVEFMSIGTLMAYAVVSASVLILRYSPSSENVKIEKEISETLPILSTRSASLKQRYKFLTPVVSLLGSQAILISVIAFTISSALFATTLKYSSFEPNSLPWIVPTLLFFATIIIISILFIEAHNQEPTNTSFAVPLVPHIPLASIFINVVLMIFLNYATWIRFIVWMILGMAIYFFYGIYHSKANTEDISH